MTLSGIFQTQGAQNSVFKADGCQQNSFGLLLDRGDATVSEFDDAILSEAIRTQGADRHYRVILSGRYRVGHGKPDGVIEVSHVSRWEPVDAEHPQSSQN